MNPKSWPQWLKLAIGALILAGNAVLPYLTKSDALSPAAHAVVTSVAGVWLLLVNTWNAAQTGPLAEARKVPPLPLLMTLGAVCIALVLTACQLFSSPQGAGVVGLGIKDTMCILDHDSEPVIQIIKDCDLVGDVAVAVTQILDSAHAAEARALAAHGVDAGVVVMGSPVTLFVDAAGLGK